MAIDDFGTGYCSLSYLKNLPFDMIKIDRSFIRDLDAKEHNDFKIVTMILTMARHLQMSVIAEGVETFEQMQLLNEHGCFQIQDYLFSQPLREEQIMSRILEIEQQMEEEVSNKQ
ncbi:hypothetical protein BTR23_14930 [Alkalihalophilus pseudofirmus]|nr:hypothetical protein BTR23_14930 [Alkalihalophilus pseudofirmus]